MADAVVFDFDGVLADSEPAHERTLLSAAERMGMVFPHERFSTDLVGFGDVECFHRIARWNERSLVDADVARLIELKREDFVHELAEGRIEAQPGAAELLASLSAAVPVALCSGSRRESVVPVLEHLGMRKHLRSVVTADDVARNKPDPEGYAKAAELLRVEPGACVAIEDTPTGLSAALDAGLRTIAVGHTRPLADLSRAHLVVERLSELTPERVLGM